MILMIQIRNISYYMLISCVTVQFRLSVYEVEFCVILGPDWLQTSCDDINPAGTSRC